MCDALAAVRDVLGDRPAVVGRELTKLHEEIYRGTVNTALAHFTEQPPRGEITLVIGGALDVPTEVWDAARVQAALDQRIAAGESRKEAARVVAAASGWIRRDVYNLYE